MMGVIKDLNGGFGSSSLDGAWRTPITQTLSGATNNIAHGFNAVVVGVMVYDGEEQAPVSNWTRTDNNNLNLDVAGTITDATIYINTL